MSFSAFSPPPWVSTCSCMYVCMYMWWYIDVMHVCVHVYEKTKRKPHALLNHQHINVFTYNCGYKYTFIYESLHIYISTYICENTYLTIASICSHHHQYVRIYENIHVHTHTYAMNKMFLPITCVYPALHHQSIHIDEYRHVYICTYI